ncbi:hypothetical protein C8Q79DRAFT_1006466 [Trametes meyenii]|nr:hypothetical protein C8Q79DRAFT_1006466 [Trametes meyenii]
MQSNTGESVHSAYSAASNQSPRPESVPEDALSAPADDKDVITICDTDTEQQRKLKEAIIAHEKEAAYLKSRLNNYIPISKLPPEIIGEIFLLHRDKVSKEFASRPLDMYLACDCPFYGWINVTQVCRSWRQIALHLPALWSLLMLDHRTGYGFTHLLASRSQNRPLSVILHVTNPADHCPTCLTLDGFFHNQNMVMHSMGDFMPSVRDLLLYVDKDEPTDTLQGLSFPAKTLEILRVEAFGDTRFKRDGREACVSIPNRLFAVQTPRLHTLAVSGVRIGFSNTLLTSSLRHLEIAACQCSRIEDPVNMGAFLECLRRLPLLESLQVDWSIKAREGDTFPPVTLPNLKQLRISDTRIPHFDIITAHIRIRQNATVHYIYPDEIGVTSARLEVLGQAVRRLMDNLPPTAVWFGSVPRLDSTLALGACKLWASPFREGLGLGPPTSSFSPIAPQPPRFVMESNYETVEDPFVFDILKPLDFYKLQRIHVDGLEVGDKWARALAAAQNVVHIRASREAGFGLPAVLARGMPTDNADPRTMEGCKANEWHWMPFHYEISRTDNETNTASLEESAMEIAAEDIIVEMIVGDEDTEMAADEDTAESESEADAAIDGAHTAREPLGDPWTAPLFPRLTELEFVGVDFVAPAGSDAASYVGESAPEEIMNVLRQYNALHLYGLSIPTLVECLRTGSSFPARDLVLTAAPPPALSY